jgi:hydrogenase nickel incorporation protein HypB
MQAKVLHNLMKANDDCARRVREFRHARVLPMLNLIGGPGCGKTTLLETTVRRLAGRLSIAVVEGDLATARDAERITAAGAEAIQINTNRGCHLEAHLVLRAIEELSLRDADLIVVENVGNLICPAEFDLGEDAKIAMVSVAEGDDKPLKYPHLFRQARAVVLNKTDLLPYVRFETRRFLDDVHQVNGTLKTFELSATGGDGIEEWLAWIDRFVAAYAAQAGV